MALTASGLFWEVREGPGPPVLLSAGLGGGAGYWAPQIEALREHFTVLLYDHRGTARSRQPVAATSVSAWADDMAEVLDTAGFRSAHVIGHAAGGMAGLMLALNHPDRLEKLVVVGGWAGPDPHIRRCFEVRLGILRTEGPAAYIRAQPLFLYPPNWISENHDRLEAEAAHQLADFQGSETLEARINALLAFDIRDRLGEIGHEVLVAGAHDDLLVPINAQAALAEGLPNGRLTVTTPGGHAFNVVQAGRFNASVVSFLTGQD